MIYNPNDVVNELTLSSPHTTCDDVVNEKTIFLMLKLVTQTKQIAASTAAQHAIGTTSEICFN